MRFGPVPVAEAEGAILAHSMQAGSTKLKKGHILGGDDLKTLTDQGTTTVWIARPDAEDVIENAAAETLGHGLFPDPQTHGLTMTGAFAGRVNFKSNTSGLFTVDPAAIQAFNTVDPAITIATLPNHARVREGQMTATIKIIPYAVNRAAIDTVLARTVPAPFSVRAFKPGTATLILTRTPDTPDKILDKSIRTLETRLTALDASLIETVTVPHETADVARAVAEAKGDMILILGASATSDAADTCPAGLVAAGGTLTRFGMPVDPGNLLFLGTYNTRPVIGLPGCARSPALNGADWVLERLAAGMEVGFDDIAAMGVGGLLKEIPARPQPRAAREARPAKKPQTTAIILAAGASRRMRGTDKLLEQVDGRSILRRTVETACASRADQVMVVLPPDPGKRLAEVEGADTGTKPVRTITATNATEGMSASLATAAVRLGPGTDAAIVLLADMPELNPAAIDSLIAAYNPAKSREICRAVTTDGTPGHPVLFGSRFFEALGAVTGDIGAREVLRASPGFVHDVPTPGRSATIDLDTPEAWAAWRAGEGG